MLLRLPESTDRPSARAWITLRVVLACLLAAHGWARLLAGGVGPFGEWLGQQGFPLGGGIAVAITALEMIATLALAYGLAVFPLTIMFASIYAVGLVLVHWPAGWFVVGLGRNGMEYSVLLIVCLVLVGVQHRPSRQAS